MPKHSKKPEVSDKRAVKTLIFRQFGLLKSYNKRQATNVGLNLKTVDGKLSGGPNPSLSANKKES